MNHNHGPIYYGGGGLLLGALVLCVLSIPQKLLLFADPWILHGFMVPVSFGGVAGLLLGLAFWKIQREREELQQARDKFDLREMQYRTYFEKHHAVMLLVDPATAHILEANPAACMFYGYSHEEITNLKITDINTLPTEVVFKEMALAKSQERKYFTFKHRLASGEVRDVEVYCGPLELRGRSLLSSVIHDITQRKQVEAERERLIGQLQEALAEIKTLSGLLPICASCKKIRDDSGHWQRLEDYIGQRSDAEFTHGICPECAGELYPDFKPK